MINVKNVTKKYGKFKAVDNISFNIKKGEIIGLLGPNGAGKSTTMNMLTGFIEPTEGTIEIDGYDISKKPIKAKKAIGYMPEGVPLYKDMKVKEFVKYMAQLKDVPKKEIKENVRKTMEETWLTDVKNVLIRNLSKGYKQRVSLAGALVGNPKILILDEPTVGLDPKQIIEIRNLIKKFGKDHTVLISSHILSEISQVCEKVIIINKGQIIAVDSPANLENKVTEEKFINIIVEDPENKMENLKVQDIKEIKLVKNNTDGTKEYKIVAQKNKEANLRRNIFNELAKENIIILELKKPEATLEEAFIELIKNNELKKAEEANKNENKKELKDNKIKKEKQKKQDKGGNK